MTQSAPQSKQKRFPKAQHLLRHADFEKVYKQGRRHFASHMTFFYLGRSIDTGSASVGTRVGFTVSKALGGAVQRNRMRRRLREAVRLHGVAPQVNADVVINPKRSLLMAEFTEIRNQIAKAFVVIEKTLQQEQAKQKEKTRP